MVWSGSSFQKLGQRVVLSLGHFAVFGGSEDLLDKDDAALLDIGCSVEATTLAFDQLYLEWHTVSLDLSLVPSSYYLSYRVYASGLLDFLQDVLVKWRLWVRLDQI